CFRNYCFIWWLSLTGIDFYDDCLYRARNGTSDYGELCCYGDCSSSCVNQCIWNCSNCCAYVRVLFWNCCRHYTSGEFGCICWCRNRSSEFVQNGDPCGKT